MASMNKLSVLLAFAPTAEQEPLSEYFLSLSVPCAEAASKGRQSVYTTIYSKFRHNFRFLCALELNGPVMLSHQRCAH